MYTHQRGKDMVSVTKVFLYVSAEYVSCPHTKTCSLPDGTAFTLKVVGSVRELFPLLSNSSFHADWVGIQVEEFGSSEHPENFDMIITLKTLMVCRKPPPPKLIGVVSHDSDPRVIRRASKHTDGLLVRPGGPFTFDDSVEIISKFHESDYTVHQTIQKLMKPRGKRVITPTHKVEPVMLTERQRQVFKLITERGSSNKTIAKVLNISESTVKLHMGAILKKYGCRNRTQLVAVSKTNRPKTEVHVQPEPGFSLTA